MLPLDDIRVLEIAQNIAIPYAGRLLAALGADVVKIEPAAGDAMRQLKRLPVPEGHPPEGGVFASMNADKRSVVLDLGSPDDRPAIEALVASADVVLLGVKPTDQVRYRLTEDDLRGLCPELIVVDQRPFGPEGPMADQGGYDVLASALAGLLFVSGRPNPDGSAPETVRPAYNDIGSALAATIGALAAIRHRDRTGEGQRVGVSLLATALAFGTPITPRFDALESGFAARWVQLEAELDERGAGFEERRRVYEAADHTDAGINPP